MKVTLDEAHFLLQQGNVVAIPTETVYGLAAQYSNETAVKKIFQIKNRPPENPLILHVSQLKDINPFVKTFSPHFETLAKHFWPGPLTLVIPIIPDTIPAIVRADLPTQAFRIPSLPITQELLKKTGPLVAPSANISGRPSSTSPEHIEHDFGSEFPVLEGGKTTHGVESTILIYQENIWHLGRLGAIAAKDFIPLLGYEPLLNTTKQLLCPGQHYRHYSPQARLHLGTQGPIILGFSDRQYPGKQILTFGSSKNPEEVLSHLYHTLRSLDQQHIADIWVDIDVPQEGLWLTFLERIKKAASKK